MIGIESPQMERCGFFWSKHKLLHIKKISVKFLEVMIAQARIVHAIIAEIFLDNNHNMREAFRNWSAGV